MRFRELLVGALLVAPHAWAQQTLAVGDSRVEAAIQKAFPGSTAVTISDIDSKGCGPLPERPGFVSGDFDGDGRPDFAALLKIGEAGKVVDWDGRKLHETRYAFAIFLANSDGGYNLRRVIRFRDYSPLGMFIALQPPGTLQGPGDAQHRRTITLKRSGIERISCEKSSVVYYLSGQNVREFWTSD